MSPSRAARGVGAVISRTLADFLATHPAALDYLELMPEMLWTDYGRGNAPRYEEMPAARAMVDRLAAQYPLVCHGIGLSIGSAMPLDEQHLAQVARTAERYGAGRYSEHLGFFRVATDPGHDRHMGLGMPLPCDEAVLDWLIPRVRRAGAVLGMPLLLENGVRHTPYVEEDMGEPQFLNRLGAATGCGVLLDLHNLYTDYRNNGSAPEAYIAELDLALVREIHVAGGAMLGKAYTDAHAGPCPSTVTALLRALVPACPRLEGITFEFHESVAPRFGPEALQDELAMLAEIWSTHHVA